MLQFSVTDFLFFKTWFIIKHIQRWIHLQYPRIAKKSTTYLFALHLGYSYGVGDKPTVRSSVPSYFIGYFDAVYSDYFSQRRQLPAQILAKGLYFPVPPKNEIYLHQGGLAARSGTEFT